MLYSFHFIEYLIHKIFYYISSYSEEKESQNHRQDLENLHRQQEEEKETDLKRAKFLLMEAIDEDESSNGGDEALSMYLDAAELCLKAVSLPCFIQDDLLLPNVVIIIHN
jgi:hypothetical protein